MKNVFQLSIIAIVALGMTSCGTASYYTYSSRTENIQSVQLQATTTLVDIDVDFKHRIVAESNWQPSVKTAQEEAQYNAIVKNGIDILVDPIFKTETNTQGNRVKVSVVGFAGYYVKHPSPTIEDIQQLKDVDIETIEKYILLHHPTMLPVMTEAENNVTINNYTEKGGSVVTRTGESTKHDADKTAKKKK